MSTKPSEGQKVDSAKSQKDTENKQIITQPKITAKLPNIIGIPVLNANLDVSQNYLMNSLMIVHITPATPQLDEGFTVFSLNNSWKEYADHVRLLGYEPGGGPSLTVAMMGDSLPSESFTNEYGESFLSNLTSGLASGASEIVQMTGEKTATAALSNLNEALAQTGTLGSSISAFLGGIARGAGDAYHKAAEGNQFLTDVGHMADKLIAGHRIDFPMIWKSSNFGTAYSFNVRLYNPSPASDVAMNQFIIGPLAALLSLAIPQSEDQGSTYNYPYMCKLNCPGLFRLEAAAITSISVSKGGDGQLVGFNQRLGLVDVRMDFVSLHNSMVHAGNISTRPTLKTYLDNLKDQHKLAGIYNTKSVSMAQKPKVVVEKTIPNMSANIVDVSPTPISRVDTKDVEIQSELEEKMPEEIKQPKPMPTVVVA